MTVNADGMLRNDVAHKLQTVRVPSSDFQDGLSPTLFVVTGTGN